MELFYSCLMAVDLYHLSSYHMYHACVGGSLTLRNYEHVKHVGCVSLSGDSAKQSKLLYINKIPHPEIDSINNPSSAYPFEHNSQRTKLKYCAVTS